MKSSREVVEMLKEAQRNKETLELWMDRKEFKLLEKLWQDKRWLTIADMPLAKISLFLYLGRSANFSKRRENHGKN